MKKPRWLWVAAGAAVVAALTGWWHLSSAPAVRIAGVDAAPVRARPEAEFVLPAALEAAREEAVRRDVRALLVHRRGHRVYEYLARDAGGTDAVEGGELAAAVLALTLHEPGQQAESDPAVVAGLVAERLWLPLRAGEAWLSPAPDSGHRFHIEARLDDWMRVGDLLLGAGTHQGERIASADAVRGLLVGRELQWQGDEPLLARDGIAFDLQEGLRLWLAPRRQLAMLVWSDAAVARDPGIPNIILRGLNDAAPAIGGGIGDIVPGH